MGDRCPHGVIQGEFGAPPKADWVTEGDVTFAAVDFTTSVDAI